MAVTQEVWIVEAVEGKTRRDRRRNPSKH